MELLNLCFGSLQMFLLVRGFAAIHSRICSSFSDLEQERPRVNDAFEYLHEIMSTCFNDAMPFLPNFSWLICANGKLQCSEIHQVISIVPSCDNCKESRIDKQSCYISQMKATKCLLNDYFLPNMKCIMKNGKEVPNCTAMYVDSDFFHPITKTSWHHSDNTTPVYVSDKPESSGFNYKKDCQPCDCPKHGEQSGLSVGVGVGLLFLGIATGSIVTALLCICVPSLHRARNRKGKVAEKVNQSALQGQVAQHLQETSNQLATDNALPVQAITVSDTVLPTATPAVPSEDCYHTLDSVNNSTNSHNFTGLQSSEYNEPMTDNATYQDTNSQPVKRKNRVVSPVYQVFTDNIVGGSGNARSQNPPIKKSDTNESANHGYSVLATDTDENCSTRGGQNYERLVSDHQNVGPGEQTSPHENEQEETADVSYHSYFTLEKPQK